MILLYRGLAQTHRVLTRRGVENLCLVFHWELAWEPAILLRVIAAEKTKEPLLLPRCPKWAMVEFAVLVGLR